jgi:hypothetical protein
MRSGGTLRVACTPATTVDFRVTAYRRRVTGRGVAGLDEHEGDFERWLPSAALRFSSAGRLKRNISTWSWRKGMNGPKRG